MQEVEEEGKGRTAEATCDSPGSEDEITPVPSFGTSK